jgi:RNA polymerase sigma factor (sigma-70 family)
LEDLQQLIQACAANDSLSQERLYRKFYPVLFLLCKRFFSDNHEALETLNDGMLKVFRSIDRYDPKKGAFFNWIYTIILHTAINKCKRVRHDDFQELKDDIPFAANNPFHTLEWKDIYTCLDMLTPATRIVCNLFYLEGLSIRDISARLDLSPGTVKWHLNETRKKLKPILERHYHLQ